MKKNSITISLVMGLAASVVFAEKQLVKIEHEAEHADASTLTQMRYSRLDIGSGDFYGAVAVLGSKGSVEFNSVFLPELGYDSVIIYARNIGSNPSDLEIFIDQPKGTSLGIVQVNNWGPHAHMHGGQKITLAKLATNNSKIHKIFLVNKGSDSISIDKLIWFGDFEIPTSKNIFVNVNIGNDDSYDGLSSTKPFKTISRAILEMGPGSLCKIAGGHYRETLRPLWSGLPSAPIRIEAMPGEEVFLSGSERVTNWKALGDGTYEANVDWNLGLGKNQIFESGLALNEARCPNARENSFSMAYNNGHQVGGTDKEPQIVWAGWEKQFTPDSAWATNRNAPCLVDNSQKLLGAMAWKFGPMWASTGIVKSVGQFSNEWHKGPGMELTNASSWLGGSDQNYVVIGKKSLLDTTGEWALESNPSLAQANYTLTLKPRQGERGLDQIEMKKRNLCLDLSGLSFIEMKGVNLHGCSATLRNAQSCKLESIKAYFISHFTQFSQTEIGNFNGSQFADFSGGNFGIYLSGANNRIENSEIAFSAASGILIYGNNQVITNNHLHHINYTGTYHAPIFVDAATNVKVEKNQIRIFGRSGIHCAGANSGNPLTINKNHIHHGGYFTGEKGAIYTYGPAFDAPDAMIADVSQNWMHDIWGWGSGAVVLDGGGRAKWRIHHNVIWHGSNQSDRDECNICWADGYNLIYNNTYLDSAKEMGNWEPRAGNNDLYLWRKDLSQWKLGNAIPLPLKSTSEKSNNLGTLFTLTAQSEAIDAGVKQIPDAMGENKQTLELRGLALNSYAGKAPDLGAYEFGGETWKAGADWDPKNWSYPDLATTSAIHHSKRLNNSFITNLKSSRGGILYMQVIDAAGDKKTFQIQGKHLKSESVN